MTKTYPQHRHNLNDLARSLNKNQPTMSSAHTAAVIVNGQIVSTGINSIRGLWQSHAETAAIARFLLDKGFDLGLIEHLRRWWGSKPVWQTFAEHVEATTGFSRDDEKQAYKLFAACLQPGQSEYYSTAIRNPVDSRSSSVVIAPNSMPSLPESRYFKRCYSQGLAAT